ncbi:arsenic resistance protein [Rhodococcus rhodnii]|uniref:Arsenic resistance protein n=1 Tax=Rhodococcus rhodnii TaxID=38312 RepID=A0A6P2CGP1_9NOCA|nr:arsenic resistance protein [Rhodococcus rhodnii]TXG91735.1 arsenic resistance protein [Rhodococcus rhodnii]
MQTLGAWATRHQAWLYVATIAVAFAAGSAIPGARVLEAGTSPVIAVLLYATFLAVPFTRVRTALRDGRFLGVLLAANFVIVPIVAFGLSRFVTHDRALVVGVLLVLLAPCVDYVIVFTALAGGAHDRLLAAAPILLLAQMLALPLFLGLFVGGDIAEAIDPGPFARAFVVMLAIPLAAAIATQFAARRWRPARVLESAGDTAMVPLMIATLAIVVASQAARIGDAATSLVAVIPLSVAFLVIMAPLGGVLARATRLDAPRGRALVFGSATRNSLVVLPLALALPAELALVPLVVVTQTLVELVGMVVYVRVVPRLIPARR